ncbi:MAG: DUF2207 domain-containing protein [Gemmatimonadales bacterium]|nr:DUF2207 domain-containing protein [Gemmatimonadales bacterium]
MRRGLALLALLALAAPAAAQRAYTIDRFDAVVAVRRDAAIEVTETVTATFTGSWNGIYRRIPVRYRNQQGFDWTIGLELLGATDERGALLRTETSRERHYVKYKVWIPGAADASRTIVLRYRATNALRFFDDHDELYWNVTGDEWDVPIGAMSATIELPPGASGVRATAFNGLYGAASQEATVTVEGGRVGVAMPRPLAYREGVTAVVGWDKGVVAEPTALDRFVALVRDNWPLALPIPVFVGMLSLWRRRGRDPASLPVSVRYAPPEGLTPAEAGTLVDERIDMRDIIATLVDLAVRGFLRIEEIEEEHLFGLVKQREYVFHRLKEQDAYRDLGEHERRVLRGVFEGDARRVELSDLRNEFYTSIPGIKDALQDRLVARGLYGSRPDKVRTRWLVGAGLVAALSIAIGIPATAMLGLPIMPFVVGGLLSAAIVAAFGWHMPARTVKGARTVEQVRGFEEFLGRVEKERFDRVIRTPEMFEAFLPFAMAFGVERKWANAFRDIYRQPPSWYVGPRVGAFDLGRFSADLGGMTSRTGDVMSSAPRSSSGSGFGGGGFSGGGGGGGGGGAF